MSKVRVGENDFGTLHPELVVEWHPTLNGSLLPCDVAAMSHKKVWWRCSKGHEWQASVDSRATGHGCPYCSGRLPVKGENDLATLRPELATEWHPTLNGALLPCNVTAMSGKKVWWQCSKGHIWQVTIEHRFKGNGCPYCSGRLPIPGETDFATLQPELAAEWHPTLNGGLLPCNVTVRSGKKVWWQCSKGHEWQASIDGRVGGSGCPYCIGHLPVPGETDLATLRPKLAAEWHPTLNKDLLPHDVAATSGKKVWWQCANGHEWQATIDNRAIGNGCPYCSGRLPIQGKTDLATRNPKLAAEWHPTLNKDLSPYDVAAMSNKKVWWQCSKGHEWQATVNNRTNGKGCPYCLGRLPIPGETDLATLRPWLVAEWHSTLNKNLSPHDVTVMSNKKVWWQCSKGHEWQAIIETRSKGIGCPYCSGRLPVRGETDLATLRPWLAAEWHPTLNKDKTPCDFTATSGKKVWWRCFRDHEWQASIDNRVKGNGCPYCAGHLAIPGETDLATLRPDLASEWHPTLNKNLSPRDVTVMSAKTVWWQCANGHEWKASINNRSNGNGCPYCAGRIKYKQQSI